ncbi:MAG: hypothetical protein MZV65_29715 [Chromatiales bacterium]|nr:hypothetical protein [Chromatiales bacterium]
MVGLRGWLASGPVHAGEELNLYSARKEDLIKPLLDRFSEQTGITVNLVTGKEDALLRAPAERGRATRPPICC